MNPSERWADGAIEVTAIAQQSPLFDLNSDRVFTDEGSGVLAVLDGDVGAGRAAEIALARLRELSALHAPDLDDVAAALGETFRRAHEDIVAFNDAQRVGIGASVTACAIRGRRIAVVHVGDTRLYARRNGAWSRVTRDHSLNAELRDAGHPVDPLHAGVVTRVLGMPGGVPDRYEVDDVDAVLLCSDGVWRCVDPSGDARDLPGDARALLDRTDGQDNASVIVAELGAVQTKGR